MFPAVFKGSDTVRCHIIASIPTGFSSVINIKKRKTDSAGLPTVVRESGG